MTDPKLKVWSLNAGNDHLVIVARSQKRAVELLQERNRLWYLSSFRNYAGETGNEKQLALAEHGEGVWIEVGRRWHGEYERLDPR